VDIRISVNIEYSDWSYNLRGQGMPNNQEIQRPDPSTSLRCAQDDNMWLSIGAVPYSQGIR